MGPRWRWPTAPEHWSSGGGCSVPASCSRPCTTTSTAATWEWCGWAACPSSPRLCRCRRPGRAMAGQEQVRACTRWRGKYPDMWASQNHLVQAGIGITGVHIEGRHFFMHHRDTFGLILELTDDRLPGDPRNGLSPTGGGDGLVPVSRRARHRGGRRLSNWSPRSWTRSSASNRVRSPTTAPRPSPNSTSVTSPSASSLRTTIRASGAQTIANGRGTLHSVTLAVDLAPRPPTRRRGNRRAHQPGSLSLDPADTFGIRLQLVGVTT